MFLKLAVDSAVFDHRENIWQQFIFFVSRSNPYDPTGFHFDFNIFSEFETAAELAILLRSDLQIEASCPAGKFDLDLSMLISRSATGLKKINAVAVVIG